MNKLITIFLFEFLSTVRRRLFLVLVAAFPVLMLALILIIRVASAVQADDEPEGPGKVRGYVDQWGRLPAELPLGAPLRPYGGEEAALSALLDDQIKSYFVIPANYIQTGIVQEYSTRPRSIFEESGVPGALRSLLLQVLVEGEVSPGIAARVQVPVLLETVRLTPEGEVTSEERDELSRFLIPYGFALLLGISVVFNSQFLAQSVTEEKQSRTMEVLLSSVSPFTLLAGKILGLGICRPDPDSGLADISEILTLYRRYFAAASRRFEHRSGDAGAGSFLFCSRVPLLRNRRGWRERHGLLASWGRPDRRFCSDVRIRPCYGLIIRYHGRPQRDYCPGFHLHPRYEPICSDASPGRGDYSLARHCNGCPSTGTRHPRSSFPGEPGVPG